MQNSSGMGRFGVAGGTASLIQNGRFMGKDYGHGTGTRSPNAFDSFLKKTPTAGLHIPRNTGPLDILRGKAVLVVADVENLTYGARDLGFKVSFQNLGLKLREVTATCDLHAFFSREPGEDGRVRYFHDRGWIAHPRDIEKVQTYHGEKVLANSDNMILLHTGFLVRVSGAKVVIVASGDGTMTCDIARFLKSLRFPREVLTMSLAGSTSSRLDATRNSDILDNIEIGLDCMHRSHRSSRLQ